jgi:pyrroloquinoline quinone (PQQ) biosynthesis protein C
MEDKKVVPGDQFLEELEGLREQVLGKDAFRPHIFTNATKEQLADARRKIHAGGDDNHRFEGERYLNVPVKSVRRKQLRKLIDEGGQTTVGGTIPSHPTLARWESSELGLTDDEMDRLQKEDPSAEKLIRLGWWEDLHRNSHWAVAIGSGLPGEGEKRIRRLREYYVDEIDAVKKQYEAVGVKNLDRALAFKREHASGTDVGHADFNAEVVNEFVDTPELQEEMRKVFVLRLQNKNF